MDSTSGLATDIYIAHDAVASVAWFQLCNELGLKCRSQNAPSRMICPFCQEPMLIVYPNGSTNAVWFHCRGCGWCGDILDVISCRKKAHTNYAVSFLANQGFIDDPSPALRRQILAYHDLRQRFTALWEKARQRASFCSIPESDHAQLLLDLDISIPLRQEEWASGIGNLVGFGDRGDISAVRKSSGRVWQSKDIITKHPVLFMASYAAPGLLAGLYQIEFVKGVGTTAKFRCVGTAVQEKAAVSSTIAVEAGLNVFGEISSDRPVLAISDPLLYLKLCGRSVPPMKQVPTPALYRTADSACNAVTHAGWAMAKSTTPVMWLSHPKPASLAMAMQHNLRIRLVQKQLREDADLALLWTTLQNTFDGCKIADGHVSWARAVKYTAETYPPAVVEATLAYAKQNNLDMQTIYYRCGDTVRRIGQTTLQLHSHRRYAANTGSYRIWCQEGKWYAENPKQKIPQTLLSDTDFLFKRLVKYPISGADVYQGVATRDGCSFDFTVPAGQIEQNPAAGFYSILRSNSQVWEGSQEYAGLLLDVLLRQSKPISVVQGVERVGWNSDTQQLVLPAFNLDGQGRVVENHPSIRAPGLPASPLPPPVQLSPAEAQQVLQDGQKQPLILRTVVHVVSCIMSGCWRVKTQGIVMTNNLSAATVHVVLSKLGAEEYFPATRDDFRRVSLREMQHDWPIFVSPIEDSGVLVNNWRNDILPQGRTCFTQMPGHIADYYILFRNWGYLSSSSRVIPPENSLDTLPRLVSSFLRAFAEQGWRSATMRKQKVMDISVSLYKYLLATSGCSKEQFPSIVIQPMRRAVILRRLLERWRQEQLVTFVPVPAAQMKSRTAWPRHNEIWVKEGTENYKISWAAIQAILTQNGLGVLGFHTLTERFRSIRNFDTVVCGNAGWWLSAS